MMKKHSNIIGIDEVGRGPLAGPVTAAAIMPPRNFQSLISNFQKKYKIKLKDSKKLSSKQREKWFKWVRIRKIPYAISSVSPKIIDKINISQAANLAATRAFKKVYKLISYKFKSSKNINVFLDGGLHLNIKNNNLKTYKLIRRPANLQTIIRGDEKIPAITLASIVAKVHRDKYMKKMHKKYPKYFFDKHKGYGTKLHYKMIKKYGVSSIHRKSFLKK